MSFKALLLGPSVLGLRRTSASMTLITHMAISQTSLSLALITHGYPSDITLSGLDHTHGHPSFRHHSLWSFLLLSLLPFHSLTTTSILSFFKIGINRAQI